jgi:hypothetical protein
MCLLTYFPPNTQPDTDALWNGTLSNHDGHGFAIVSRGALIVRHGMNGDEMIELFASMRKRHADGPALFHSRFGTGGVYTRFNCHPFRFKNDRHTVVGHNGVLPETCQPGKKDKRCDTRYAADEVFPKGFGHLSNPVNRDKLGEFIGKSNKLVILTTNPEYDQSAYIINEDRGIWHEGVWYSNTGYQDKKHWYTGTVTKPKTACPLCGCTSISKYAHCLDCKKCVECRQGWDNCNCTYWNYGTTVSNYSAWPTVLGNRSAGTSRWEWADNDRSSSFIDPDDPDAAYVSEEYYNWVKDKQWIKDLQEGRTGTGSLKPKAIESGTTE